MSATVAAVLYLLSGLLCVPALRGLSHPTAARRGAVCGMAGIGIAVAATLLLVRPSFGALLIVVLGLAIGGGAGAIVAGRIPMAAMPQLVAAVPALAGLAAVTVAATAIGVPESVGLGTAGAVTVPALAGLSVAAAFGATTVTGSLVAVLRLSGRMRGRSVLLRRHLIVDLALAAALLVCVVLFPATGGRWLFWPVVLLALVLGARLVAPIGCADIPLVVPLLNSGCGWAAAALGFALQNLALIIAGALVGSTAALLSSRLCEGQNRSLASVIRGGVAGGADPDDRDRPASRGEEPPPDDLSAASRRPAREGARGRPS